MKSSEVTLRQAALALRRQRILRASKDFITQLENLYTAYEEEVTEKEREGLLTSSTAKTYLLHSGNFLKWCQGEFVPGQRNGNERIPKL